jgi:hypothetical protein
MKKESILFLKKRTKKLFLVQVGAWRSGAAPTDRSFLLLFFRKQDLPYFAKPPGSS